MASPSTGTTIVAVKYKDGVVLGADSRVSTGIYISNRASSKLTPIINDIYLLRSGSAADAQAISDYARTYAEQLRNDTGREPSVVSVANIVKMGGQVYCVPIGGTVVEDNFAADGSGSIYILGLMDQMYRPDMTEEDAISFITASLAGAMSTDGSSGGMCRLVVTNAQGSRRVLVNGAEVPLAPEEAQTRRLTGAENVF